MISARSWPPEKRHAARIASAIRCIYSWPIKVQKLASLGVTEKAALQAMAEKGPYDVDIKMGLRAIELSTDPTKISA